MGAVRPILKTIRRISLKLCMWIELVKFPSENFFENLGKNLCQKLWLYDHFFPSDLNDHSSLFREPSDTIGPYFMCEARSIPCSHRPSTEPVVSLEPEKPRKNFDQKRMKNEHLAI